MKKLFLVSSAVVGTLTLTGCCCRMSDTPRTPAITTTTQNNTITQINKPLNKQNISQTPGLITKSIIRIEANGIGVAPASSISPAQSTAMARRAGIIDGYKALTEKLYGIKINGRETVKDMILKDSTLRTRIAGIIRGATIEDETYKNGMYRVVMSLKLNLEKWNRYLRHNPPYYYNY